MLAERVYKAAALKSLTNMKLLLYVLRLFFISVLYFSDTSLDRAGDKQVFLLYILYYTQLFKYTSTAFGFAKILKLNGPVYLAFIHHNSQTQRSRV